MFKLSEYCADEILGANLRRLVKVRALAILGELGAIAGAAYGLGMPLPLAVLYSIVAIHLLLNLVTWWRTKVTQHVTAIELFYQLCSDTVVLLLLLYFSGGASNPFVSMLLLPLVVAAAILPRVHVWVMAALVMIGYGLLMYAYRPAQQHGEHQMHNMASEFDWHVMGMWFGFLLGVAVVVFFVFRMAESLRERDRILAEARERSLRDENLVALGTLAAGAAHELGTPLSTMAVLSKDLEQEYEDDPALAKRLSILRQQVDRCKETLAMISVSSGEMRAESGHSVRLDEFIKTVVSGWRQRYPNATLNFDMKGEQPVPQIIAEKGLSQALITFLDNAADSSPNDIDMVCAWDLTTLFIEIADRGAGMPQEFLDLIGKKGFTTKPEGHGLGLLLAHSIIQRLGGEITVQSREGGGTLIKVNLHLAKLLVNG